MENKTEIINNDSQPIIKVKKPVSEAQLGALNIIFFYYFHNI